MADFTLSGMSALLKGKLGPDLYSPQIASALSLACRGHQGQFREQADPRQQRIPYIAHPVGVAILAAELAASAGISDSFDDLISACLTHDLLEDSDVTPFELETAASKRTAELVLALTRPSRSKFTSQDQRNAAFLASIKAAGRTAVFVKICDSLHNLSRPEQTPRPLLEKTLLKARSQYLPLLETEQLGPAVHQRYIGRIDEVAVLLAQQRASGTQSEYADIEAVFTAARERVSHKTLESHDVANALKDFTGAIDVALSSLEDYLTARGLHQGAPPHAQDVLVEDLPAEVRVGLSRVVRIIMVHLKAPGDGDRSLLVLLPDGAPDWVSVASLTVLASFLFERAALQAAGAANELHDVIRTIGLDLDPHLAYEAGLGAEDVRAIASQLDGARIVRAALDPLLLGNLPPSIQARVERRESRIKSATSLINKTVTQRIPLADVEDVLGYRFVTPLSADRVILIDFIVDQLNLCDLRIDQAPVVTNIRTSKGYVADHVLVRVPVRLCRHSITVEVQVRTILDDAWARISHAIDYKKSHVVVRKNARLLKKIREAFDALEKDF